MSGGKRSAAGRKRGSVRASTRLQQTPREYGGGKLIPPLARSWNFLAGRMRTRMLSYMMLAHATVSSMKPGITADLVIGTCVLIAIVRRVLVIRQGWLRKPEIRRRCE